MTEIQKDKYFTQNVIHKRTAGSIYSILVIIVYIVL